jgi:hypothetical protein
MDYLIIGFSKPKNRLPIIGYALSKLIQFFEGTNFSHAYISWYSKSLDRVLFYEAVGGGVRFQNKEYFDNYVEIVEEYKIPVVDSKKIVSLCIDSLNKKYGILEIIGIGYRLIMAKIGIKVKNPFINNQTYFCTEMAFEILKTQNAELKFDKQDISVKELNELIKQWLK